MMLDKFKAIIFDCDGTLINSELLHYQAWRYALQQHSYELTEKSYIQRFIGNCDLLIAKNAFDFLGFDCSERLLHDKNKYYLSNLHEVSPIAPTIRFLNCLIQNKDSFGLKLAVASAAPKEEIIHNLGNLCLESSFDVILSGVDDLADYEDKEGTNKPKPYIYQKAARLLGVEPYQCIAIEDSRSGVSAAVAAGCITVAVPNEFSRHQDLSHAHLKIESFESLDFHEFLLRLHPFV